MPATVGETMTIWVSQTYSLDMFESAHEVGEVADLHRQVHFRIISRHCPHVGDISGRGIEQGSIIPNQELNFLAELATQIMRERCKIIEGGLFQQRH
jgi:hypothetical protein